MASAIEPTDTRLDDDRVYLTGDGSRSGSRVIRDPVTGFSAVARRPGQRMITSEEIQEMLEDFP